MRQVISITNASIWAKFASLGTVNQIVIIGNVTDGASIQSSASNASR